MHPTLRTSVCCLLQTSLGLSLQVRKPKSKVSQDGNLHIVKPWPETDGKAWPRPAGLITEPSGQDDTFRGHDSWPCWEGCSHTCWWPQTEWPLRALEDQISFCWRCWKPTFGEAAGNSAQCFPVLAHTETNASEASPSPQATTTVSPLHRINFCSECAFVNPICL